MRLGWLLFISFLQNTPSVWAQTLDELISGIDPAVYRSGQVKPFVEAIAKQGGFSVTPLAVMNTRSIQTDTDAQDPRLVFFFSKSAPEGRAAPQAGGRYSDQGRFEDVPLMLAYSKRTGAFEVQNWNPRGGPNGSGGYEFRVISNFASKAPSASPHDSSCLDCHSGSGGPLFWRNGWESTQADPIAVCLMKKYMGQSFNDYLGFDLRTWLDDPKDPLDPPIHFSQALGVSQGGVRAIQVEKLVNSAAMRVAAQKTCALGCGSNTRCKRLLLKAAFLNPGGTSSLRTNHDQELGALLKPYMDKNGAGSPFISVGLTEESPQSPRFQQKGYPEEVVAECEKEVRPIGFNKQYPERFWKRRDEASVKHRSRALILDRTAKVTRLKKMQEASVGTPLSRVAESDSSSLTGRLMMSSALQKEPIGFPPQLAFSCLGFGESELRVLRGTNAEQIEKVIDSFGDSQLADWPKAARAVFSRIQLGLGAKNEQGSAENAL